MDKFKNQECEHLVLEKIEALVQSEQDIENLKQLLRIALNSIGLKNKKKAEILLKYKKLIDFKDQEIISIINSQVNEGKDLLGLFLSAKTLDEIPKTLLAEIES